MISLCFYLYVNFMGKKRIKLNSDLTFTCDCIRYVVKYPSFRDNRFFAIQISNHYLDQNFIKLMNTYNVPFILSTNLYDYIIHRNKIVKQQRDFVANSTLENYFFKNIDMNEYSQFILMKDIYDYI